MPPAVEDPTDDSSGQSRRASDSAAGRRKEQTATKFADRRKGERRSGLDRRGAPRS